MTMTFIQHIKLGSSQTTIEFTYIASSYTDLFLVYSLRSNTTGNTEFYLKLNNTNPTQRQLRGNGSGAVSNTDAWQLAPATGQTSNTFGNGQIYIPNYTGTAQKSASVDNVTENNATTAFQSIYASLYNVTSAVTSIQITDNYGQWIAGSTATLYGITKGTLNGVTVS